MEYEAFKFIILGKHLYQNFPFTNNSIESNQMIFLITDKNERIIKSLKENKLIDVEIIFHFSKLALLEEYSKYLKEKLRLSREMGIRYKIVKENNLFEEMESPYLPELLDGKEYSKEELLKLANILGKLSKFAKDQFLELINQINREFLESIPIKVSQLEINNIIPLISNKPRVDWTIRTIYIELNYSGLVKEYIDFNFQLGIIKIKFDSKDIDRFAKAFEEELKIKFP